MKEHNLYVSFNQLCLFSSTVEPQSYEPESYGLTSQPNTKLEKKVGKVSISVPVYIRLRIPSTRIAVAAMLWAPFTEENNSKRCIGRENSCSKYNSGLWA